MTPPCVGYFIRGVAMGVQGTDDPFKLADTVVGGRYAIECAVAAGGFGVVYRARHATLGALVAVKVLRLRDTMNTELRTEFTRKFVDEARIVARLEHPAVVRVLDFGVDAQRSGSLYWMAMEWVDGVTLTEDIALRHGGYSPRACLDLLSPVFEALTLAHRRGIVHRDLKPGNLMLPSLPPEFEETPVRRSAVVRLKVLDFGIAKVMTDCQVPVTGTTETGVDLLAYSPSYAAPEQLRRARTGPWTDVHAMGLILTEMLTGARAYQGRDLIELAAEAMAATRPTPGFFGVDVGAWEAVIAKALAPHPADRFGDAGAFLAALEAEVPEAVRVGPGTPPAMGTAGPALAGETVPTLRPAAVHIHDVSPRSPRRTALAVLCSIAAVAGATWGVASRLVVRPLAPTTSTPGVHAAPPSTDAALVVGAGGGPSVQQPHPPAHTASERATTATIGGIAVTRRDAGPRAPSATRRRRRVTPE